MMAVVDAAGVGVEDGVDAPLVVLERLEAFASGVLAGAMNRPVQVVNGGLYLQGLIEQGARKIVLGSGARPALARTLPWMQGPYADLVRESIARHDPGATPSPGSVRASATRINVPKRESTRSSRSKGRKR